MQPLRNNFVTRYYYGRRQLTWLLRLLILGLASIVLWQACDLSQLWQQHRVLRSSLTKLEGKAAAASQRRVPSADLKQEEHAYRPFAVLVERDALSWTALLSRLEEVIPDGVRLTSLSPDYEQQSIQLNGEATGPERLRLFIDQLNRAGFSRTLLLGQKMAQVEDPGGRKRPVLNFSMRLEGGL